MNGCCERWRLQAAVAATALSRLPRAMARSTRCGRER